MAWGDDEEQQGDGLTASLVYGSKEDGTEAQPAAPAMALPGAQPAQGDFSTGEGATGGGMARASATNREPVPPTYNPTPVPTVPDRREDQFQQFEKTLQAPAPSRNDAALKPKWYERLAGGVSGAMVGFQNPELGVKVGSGVTDRRFNTATEDYQHKQDTARQGMTDLRAERQDANQAFEQRMQIHNAGTTDYNAQERAYQGQVMAKDRAAQEQQRLQAIAPGSEQPDDPKNPMGTWHATTIGGQPMKLNQPPDRWLNSSQGKQEQESARREALVRDNRLTGADAKYVRVNGKLREPSPTTNIHIPSAEAEKYHDMKSAFHKENGRDPNLSELQSIMQGEHARGSMKKADADAIIAARNKGFEKAQQAYHKAIASAETDQDRQEAENDYLDAAETVQHGYEDRLRSKTGNDIEPFDIRGALGASLHGAKPQSQPAPAQAQPQAQQAAPAQPQQAAPQQQKPATAAPAQRFNVAKWKAANPKGDVNKAIAAAKAKGYELVGQ
jgi:hypothetical protein